jgi:hypothetical protein
MEMKTIIIIFVLGCLFIWGYYTFVPAKLKTFIYWLVAMTLIFGGAIRILQKAGVFLE